MLLPCWALVAEPQDLLVAFQPDIVGEVPLRCIACMVPFCQKSFASGVLTLCKGRLPSLLGLCMITTFWAASLLADSRMGCCTPVVATHLAQPTNKLIAVCHQAVWGESICFVVPLSCN